MSYFRVIPRDFFNEAKLLKCMGRLALLILDGLIPCKMELEADTEGNSFNIKKNPNDGSIYVLSYMFYIKDMHCHIFIPENSKRPYPLFIDIDEETYPIFDDNGEFTEVFIKQCKKL